ncbi:MCP methyltransferase, CheR-type [Tistlia consotensis]|uniref:Chemotaxis protein methyltransferase n=1 Tax=Tistlia consotensis USBA 355 TaxID=560819 RepID=A0A1Y6CMK7_9PROT|nr:protein-glutamate O-methyltransferase CheR [Tistlia consotensis]SMF76393.1 MCP methyltransferase, CheR-type [Tistlia consotensis USBA 355]SNS12836.1 MCP methyltransferase, CheR-type [Tistlia consotensis]
MSPQDFDFIAQLLKQRSGLTIGPDKAYLLESRLNPVARKHGFNGLTDLIQGLRLRGDQTLTRDVVEAMTTNESFFFRDTKPFDQFKRLVLPHLLEKRAAKRSFRIWSAACSSGQEAYSLSMILKEFEAKLAGWRVEMIATDLSTEILDKAKEGVYSQFEVQRGLPVQLLVKHFAQEGDRWRIAPDIKRMVTFRTFNLLDDPAPLGQFDVVFLRNVLIYFDQPTKTKVLERVSRQMAPDGFLYLGGAETVLGISDKFQVFPGERGIYGLSAAAQPRMAATA